MERVHNREEDSGAKPGNQLVFNNLIINTAQVKNVIAWNDSV